MNGLREEELPLTLGIVGLLLFWNFTTEGISGILSRRVVVASFLLEENVRTRLDIMTAQFEVKYLQDFFLITTADQSTSIIKVQVRIFT